MNKPEETEQILKKLEALEGTLKRVEAKLAAPHGRHEPETYKCPGSGHWSCKGCGRLLEHCECRRRCYCGNPKCNLWA
jgi:hypothetical protein